LLSNQLNQSYRCPKTIIKASGQVLTEPEAAFLSGGPSRVKISIAPHPSDKAEGEFVARAIDQLLDLCGDYPDPHAFLDYLALGAVADDYSAKSEADSLMTLHASKGLEFDAVFIPGCEQGLIPYALFTNQQPNIAEEQRLLYVGMTRAKKHLFLSHADRRFLLGKEYICRAARFWTELNRSCWNKREKKPDRRKRRLRQNNSHCSEAAIGLFWERTEVIPVIVRT